jgi:CheY-like chemotaxis protein
MPARVLLIDDQPSVTYACGAMLEAEGFVVRGENDATRALETAREFRPDVVVLDLLMPGMSGADVAWQFASSEEFRALPLVVLTGFPGSPVRSALPPREVQILTKPVTVEALVGAVLACLANGSPQMTNDE